MENALVEIFQEQDQYFLWLTEIDDYSMSMSVQVTDGANVWNGMISIGDKPHSREQESAESFFHILKSSLIDVNYSSNNYSFTRKGNKMQLLIKENLDTMSALLLKVTLTSSTNEQSDVKAIFSSLCEVSKLKNKSIEEHKKEIIASRHALDTLTSEVSSFRKSRDDYMSSFLTKFCLVVNSKKSEIQRLCDEVDRLREEVHSLQTHSSMPEKHSSSTSGTTQPITSGSSVSSEKRRGRRKASSKSDNGKWEDLSDEDEEDVISSLENSSSAPPTSTSNTRTTRGNQKGSTASSEAMSHLLAARGKEVNSQALDVHLTQQFSQSLESNEGLSRTRSKRSSATVDGSDSADVEILSVPTSSSSFSQGAARKRSRTRRDGLTESQASQEFGDGMWEDDKTTSSAVVDNSGSGSLKSTSTTQESVSQKTAAKTRGRRKKQIFDLSSSEEEEEPADSQDSITSGRSGSRLSTRRLSKSNDVMNYM